MYYIINHVIFDFFHFLIIHVVKVDMKKSNIKYLGSEGV
jgi:hypothetical protein